jgi:hypothetical protein
VTATLLAPDDARWTRFLASIAHDFYHLPSYLEVAAGHEGGRPVAVLAEQDGHALLAPLLIRPLPAELDAPEWHDALVPYGFGTPLVTPGVPPATAAALVDHLIERLRAERIASAFFRLHTVLGFPHEALAPRGQLVTHGEVVHLDLTQPRAALDAGLKRDHRSHVRRLLDAGYEFVRDESWQHLDAFVDLYHRTMRRNGATALYLFPRDYFVALRAALGGRLHLSAVVSPEGEVAAAGLHSVIGWVAQGLLNGSHPEHYRMAPAKLVIVGTRDWAREQGARVLNLGGGLGGQDDSLLSFKKGFGPGRGTFATWRVVPDVAVHESLVAAWERRGGTRSPGATDYFPLYRKAVAPMARSAAA